jgi:predicted nucleotidyltransferase
MKPDIPSLVRELSTHTVDFIIVGGVAAALHGAARATYDLDIVYARAESNIARLVSALEPLHPYLRGAPSGLPFRFDADTIRRGLNFTLTTDLGDLDLFGEIVGGGLFENLVQETDVIALERHQVRILTLERLIATKRAAGRPRDHDALAELEVLLEERHRTG